MFKDTDWIKEEKEGNCERSGMELCTDLFEPTENYELYFIVMNICTWIDPSMCALFCPLNFFKTWTNWFEKNIIYILFEVKIFTLDTMLNPTEVGAQACLILRQGCK